MRNHRSLPVLSVVLFPLFLSIPVVAAIEASPPLQLVADDALTDSMFGWQVDIDGDTAVVSAFADERGTGAAYIFERGASGWQQVAKLTASDGEERDALGFSVAISGDTVVLGAALDDNDGGTDAGAVYIYVKPAGGWRSMTQDFKLTSPEPRPHRGFGGAVALVGEVLVVGAPGKDDAPSSGDVFVFQGEGSSWSHRATLNVPGLSGYDAYGSALDFDGTTVVVGAFGRNSSSGAAYVYRKHPEGWQKDMSLEAELLVDDGVANDNFGGSVAVYGDTIVAGANRHDWGGDAKDAGSAYLFTRSGGSWVLQQKLAPSNRRPVGNFGYAVAIAGDRVAIGASHPEDNATDSVYIFDRNGNRWQEQGILNAPAQQSDSGFGLSVALDENATTLLAGAPQADAGDGRGQRSAGAAYLIELKQPSPPGGGGDGEGGGTTGGGGGGGALNPWLLVLLLLLLITLKQPGTRCTER